MRCKACGHENNDAANFCNSCGESLLAEPESETTVIYGPGDVGSLDGSETSAKATPGGPAVLVVQRGPNAGTKFEISSDRVTIGRHPDSDFFLDDVTVSRRHAEVRRVGDDYVIKDVGSLNGTYVNGERVEEAPVNFGDEFRVGKYVVSFVQGHEGG